MNAMQHVSKKTYGAARIGGLLKAYFTIPHICHHLILKPNFLYTLRLGQNQRVKNLKILSSNFCPSESIDTPTHLNNSRELVAP